MPKRNYDPDATEDDGSCLAFNVCGECEGEELSVSAARRNSLQLHPEATIDDESCFAIDAPAAQSATQGADPVTFTAEPASFWFETETAPEVLAISDTYTLPLLTGDGGVWVAHSNAEYDVVGGKAAPDFENGQHHPTRIAWSSMCSKRSSSNRWRYSEEGGFHTLKSRQLGYGGGHSDPKPDRWPERLRTRCHVKQVRGTNRSGNDALFVARRQRGRRGLPIRPRFLGKHHWHHHRRRKRIHVLLFY